MAIASPRLLLAVASSILALAGTAHALAFKRAVAGIASSNLPPFLGNSSKALWLGDSATSFILAVLFALIAVRPSAGTGSLVVVLALVPAATAILIYRFLGNFYAGHILLAAAAAAMLAGLQLPKP